MLIVLFGSSSVMLSYWFNGMLNLSYAAVRPCEMPCSSSCCTLHLHEQILCAPRLACFTCLR